MRMQKVSKGYQLSNLGITQRCADQMVVVGKIEGKRPKFLPLIGLGQQPRKRSPIMHHDPGFRSSVCTPLRYHWFDVDMFTKITFERNPHAKYENASTQKESLIIVAS